MDLIVKVREVEVRKNSPTELPENVIPLRLQPVVEHVGYHSCEIVREIHALLLGKGTLELSITRRRTYSFPRIGD